MATSAHGNSNPIGSSVKSPEVGFEASGLSAEEAERLAAAFRPSWEFDEAPFAQGSPGLDAGQIDALAASAPPSVDAGHDARNVAAHAPPARVETHEPEVSVIIDRSITAAEMEAARAAAARPPPPAPVQFAAPAFAQPAFPAAAPARVAPVLRPQRLSADESIEIPASLTKSNKGLFIGLGVAVAATALVFVVHGMMTSSETSTTPVVATAAAPVETASPIPPPAAATVATPPAPAPAPPPVAAAPSPSVVAALPAPVRAAPATHAAPRPAAPAAHHAAAPKNPPKPAGGGIVRDVPF